MVKGLCLFITVMLYCFICSCRNTDIEEKINDDLLSISAELIIDTDWRYNTNYSGVFKDFSSNEEFIYSGDPITHLKVRIFGPQGNILQDIALDSAFRYIDKIKCIAMLARDSLIVFEERGTGYLILDTLGTVVRKRFFMESELRDQDGQLYELYPANSGLTILDYKVYLGPALKGEGLRRQGDPGWVNMQRYFQFATSSCKIASFSLRDTTGGGVGFGACNILKHLTDTARNTVGSAFTTTVDNKIFLFTRYSDVIHEIDTATLLSIRSIPISYMKGRVGIIPPPITDADVLNDGHISRASSQAHIFNFGYDEPTNTYLVSVYHEVPESAPEEDRGSKRDWSLIVLDRSYKKVDEHVISGNDHSGRLMLHLSSGTWMFQRNDTPQAFKEPKVFHRLDLQ